MSFGEITTSSRHISTTLFFADQVMKAASEDGFQKLLDQLSKTASTYNLI
jgi:hypothetical protein